VVGQRAVAILAATNINRDVARHRAKPNFTTALFAFRSGDVHRHFAVGNGYRHRQGKHGRIPPCLCNGFFNCRLVASKHMDHAIDDDLRGVDFAITAGLGISTLADGMAVQRQCVFPAEIVPVVDRQAHGHK